MPSLSAAGPSRESGAQATEAARGSAGALPSHVPVELPTSAASSRLGAGQPLGGRTRPPVRAAVAGAAARVQCRPQVQNSALRAAAGGLSSLASQGMTLALPCVAPGSLQGLNVGGGSVAADALAARKSLQTALAQLAVAEARRGATPQALHGAQTHAHAALRAYSNQPLLLGDAAASLTRQVLAVGAAGTGMTFGLTRNAGIAAAAVGAPRGARPSPATIAHAAAQWIAGAFTGAVGNITGQLVLKPLIGLINGFDKINPRAVVTDAMVEKLNELQAGAGDALRRQVQDAQREASVVNSPSNLRNAEWAFDVATGARLAAQGSHVGDAGHFVGVGVAVSAMAGAFIGAGMALNMARAEVRVPDLGKLDEELQRPAGERDLEALLANHGHTVKLFHVSKPEAKPVKALQDSWQASNIPDPAPASAGQGARNRPADWRGRAEIIGADLSNLTASVVRRAGYLMDATVALGTASAVTPFVAAQMPDEGTRRLVQVTAGVIGIHRALRPFGGALGQGIAEGDRAMRATRQAVVDHPERAIVPQVAAPTIFGNAVFEPADVPPRPRSA
jgi:hypothetical protein